LHFGFISLFLSAKIYIHKLLNCNSKSRLIAAGYRIVDGNLQGKRKKGKKKRKKGEQQQQRR
jgi:hypothetical protein